MPLVIQAANEIQQSTQTLESMLNISHPNEYGLFILLFLFLIVIFRNPLFALFIGLSKAAFIVGVLYLIYLFFT